MCGFRRSSSSTSRRSSGNSSSCSSIRSSSSSTRSSSSSSRCSSSSRSSSNSSSITSSNCSINGSNGSGSSRDMSRRTPNRKPRLQRRQQMGAIQSLPLALHPTLTLTLTLLALQCLSITISVSVASPNAAAGESASVLGGASPPRKRIVPTVTTFRVQRRQRHEALLQQELQLQALLTQQQQQQQQQHTQMNAALPRKVSYGIQAIPKEASASSTAKLAPASSPPPSATKPPPPQPQPQSPPRLPPPPLPPPPRPTPPSPPPPKPRILPSGILKYFGGPVMTDSLDVYLLFYGDWNATTPANGSGSSPTSGQQPDGGQRLFRTFINSLSGQASGVRTVRNWWNVTSRLMQKDGRRVAQQVRLAAEVHDWYSLGKTLTNDESSLFKLVSRCFQLKMFNASSAAAYFVLTSPDVLVGDRETGFCGKAAGSYCGFHSVTTYKPSGASKGIPLYTGFIGNANTQCPGACNGNPGPSSPNNNLGVDGMISIFAHELAEIATDPDLMTGWLTNQDETGAEIADLCMGWYGTPITVTVPPSQSSGLIFLNQYNYNLVGLNSTRFYVQGLYNGYLTLCARSVTKDDRNICCSLGP